MDETVRAVTARHQQAEFQGGGETEIFHSPEACKNRGGKLRISSSPKAYTEGTVRTVTTRTFLRSVLG